MRFGVVLIVALLLSTLTGAAESWKNSGTRWVLKGVSVTQPGGLKVKVETGGKDNSLRMTGVSDDYFIGFFLLESKADAEKVIGALKGAMKGVAWEKKEFVDTEKFGMVLQEGQAKGASKAHATAGYLVKGNKYLVFLSTYPDGKKKLYEATVAVLGSVDFGK